MNRHIYLKLGKNTFPGNQKEESILENGKDTLKT